MRALVKGYKKGFSRRARFYMVGFRAILSLEQRASAYKRGLLF
jgi:hypothetical protein